jgi:4-diphosphocytidyl-2-C-methyl-D-erythritol kinase
MSRSLILRPSAKINLMLRVGPARSDGFHDVRTVLQSIALSDTLVLTARKGPFVLATRAPGVPADRTNLVWRAAEVLWRALGRAGEPRDVHIKLEKQIPTAAGLGGGSADAAAALAGLNRLWAGGLERRDLVRLAAELGSDVPFFLHGGTALGAGRGEELYPLEDAARLGLVVIKPSFGVAARDAYRWLDEDRQTGNSPAAASVLDIGWSHGPVSLMNDLEGPVARRHPEIAEMVGALRQEGAMGAGMTGSGSAVFGVFSEPMGRKAARQLQKQMRPDRLVLLTRTISRREAERRGGL